MIVAALFLSALFVRPSAGLSIIEEILVDWTGATTIALTLHLLTFYVLELYNLRLDFRSIANTLRVVAAVAIAGIFVALASFAVPEWGFSRRLFVYHGVLLTVFAVVNRRVVTRAHTTRRDQQRALLVTVGATPQEIVDEFFQNPESAWALVGTVAVDVAQQGAEPSTLPPPVGTIEECERALARSGARHLIVAGIDRLPQSAAEELLRLKSRGIEVHDLVDLYEALAARLPLGLIDDRYFLRVPAFTRDTQPVLSNLTRLLDVGVALVLAVLALPLMALAVIGIKLTMPGPVFFAQERVGEDEVPYTVYKFRSMHLDAERDGPQYARGPSDPRVTPFGRFLRRSRIDELPQLWNVFVGDMSLVGPRPERPVFVEELKREIPYYALRFQVKPGLTGWAQVNYRYGSSIDDTRVKLSYDLFYVQARSVPLFALTLLKTVTTVLFKPGS
jgi:exopolysaccharide biosynthesis polyprenyl glycosylphosphotransferase